MFFDYRLMLQGVYLWFVMLYDKTSTIKKYRDVSSSYSTCYMNISI